MSFTIEGVYFIFMEEMTEQDMLKRKKMLWNGLELDRANKWFEEYKLHPDCNGKECE
jgi:hypothetical protein